MGARLGQALLLTALAAAQPRPPGPVTRGTLLETETAAAGQFSLRTAGHAVYRFTFDSKTYFERERTRTSAARLRAGDQVEVVSDELPGALLRYARTVHVIERQPPRLRLPTRRYRAYRSSLEHLVPRGDLTFAGVVRRLNDGILVLRTRGQGDKTIVLRQDTTYLQDGEQVSAAELPLNVRVFVRGARNLDDELEAYQVVWGRILEPEKGP